MNSTNEPITITDTLESQTLKTIYSYNEFLPYVFIAGPSINFESDGAKLRTWLHDRLTEQNVRITFGEFPKLIESTSILGEANNTLLAELNHARDKVIDAIIILPCSSGSFLELGSFCVYPDLCQKMLIIIDKEYEEHKSFLNLGPVLEAKRKGSIIDYVSYKDQVGCLESAGNFLTRIKQNTIANRIISGKEISS